MMRVVNCVLLGGLVIALGVPAFAQPRESVEFEGDRHTCAVVGDTSSIVCSAQASFPLYREPPRSIPFLPFFLLSPDETGTVRQGMEFSIRDRRTVDLLGERSRWLLLQTPDGSETLGWSYAGSAAGLSDIEIDPQTTRR